MITDARAVRSCCPSPISLAEATRRFESSAPKYQNLPGLVRKYYVRARRTAAVAGGIYLWEIARRRRSGSTTANGARASRQLCGAKPAITRFDTPVVVDNLAGGAITKAA